MLHVREMEVTATTRKEPGPLMIEQPSVISGLSGVGRGGWGGEWILFKLLLFRFLSFTGHQL